MLFNLFRIILWIVLSIIVIFKIRKSKIRKKQLLSVLSVFICYILVSITCIFPVENLFIHFKTPEEVFSYASSGQISDIVYGKDSCMVVYSIGDTQDSLYFIPKSETGYKIPGAFSEKKVANRFDQVGSFDVYNVSGTSDYYIFGFTHTNETTISITNSDNTEARKELLETGGSTNEKYVVFYSFIEDFTNNNFLFINGNKVIIPLK